MTGKGVLIILLAALTACAHPDALSDQEFLTRCWSATAIPAGSSAYELSFEAILIPGTEGRTIARSRTCPHARMVFGALPPNVAATFREVADRVPTSSIGTGLKGRARVVPMERRSPQYLRVRVTRMLTLEQMSLMETQAFVTEHHIG